MAFVTALLVVILSCTWGGHAIRHGEPAAVGEFPYIVQLAILDGTELAQCGGAIITKKHVLTAAHCVSEKAYNGIQPFIIVFAGTIGWGDATGPDTQLKSVNRTLVHEDFVLIKKQTANNDIAILELDSPFEFNHLVKPIKLPKQNETFEGTVVTCGWGDTEVGFTDTLLKTTAQLVQPSSDCYEQMEDNFKDNIADKSLRAHAESFEEKLMHGQLSEAEIKAFIVSVTRDTTGVTLSDAEAQSRAQLIIKMFNNTVTASATPKEDAKRLFFPDTTLCAKGDNSSGICKGDSGGPLVSYVNNEPYLVGVTSWGMIQNCAKFNAPSTFTRVASYSNWIENRILA